MKFSVVVPHFDGTITDDVLLRGLDCLHYQTLRDLEVILLHDGPISRPLPIQTRHDLVSDVIITSERYNDWGHSLRDLGIRQARGEYIVHFNADNILYPFALEEIALALRDQSEVGLPEVARSDGAIAVFPIVMRGMRTNGKVTWRDPNSSGYYTILIGFPPLAGLIDCMQLVMRRELWLKYGGWYDKDVNSDGSMYPQFIKQHGACYISRILGEHW
jgi:hypothetical protein